MLLERSTHVSNIENPQPYYNLSQGKSLNVKIRTSQPNYAENAARKIPNTNMFTYMILHRLPNSRQIF